MLTFGIFTQADMTKVNISWSERYSNSGEINGTARRVVKAVGLLSVSHISAAAAAAAKLLQSCPTLCNPIDRSPPGSPVPGILQARTLEWVAISFSNA